MPLDHVKRVLPRCEFVTQIGRTNACVERRMDAIGKSEDGGRENRPGKVEQTVARRASRYEAFWGRRVDAVFHPTDAGEPHIDVFRFPPVAPGWFLKRWMTPAYRHYVYVTGGMSDAAMPGAAAEAPRFRTELTAYSNRIYKNQTGDADMVAWWLHFLASAPFRFPEEGLFFSVGHTFSTREPLVPGSAMTGFLFSVTPGVEIRRLCSCTLHARVVLHVVPISDSERRLTQKDPRALIDYFGKHAIEPVFDLERKPYI
jgi:hypothetical protein